MSVCSKAAAIGGASITASHWEQRECKRRDVFLTMSIVTVSTVIFTVVSRAKIFAASLGSFAIKAMLPLKKNLQTIVNGND
jgi:hypothetical protein